MRAPILVVAACCLLGLPAWAAEVDGCHPTCGAPGDLVYLQGRALGPRVEVRFGGRLATIVRRRGAAVCCRVPEGLEPGRADLEVAGRIVPGAFLVLPAQTPVLHGATADVATPGGTLLLRGLRLRGARFVLRGKGGGRRILEDVLALDRVASVRLPDELPSDHYDLVAENTEMDRAPAPSLDLEVRAADEPVLFAVRADPVVPGTRITCLGADLSPSGGCILLWEDGEGSVIPSFGESNGYDRVFLRVPPDLPADRSYGLVLGSTAAREAPVIRVFVTSAAPPRGLGLDVLRASAGSTVALRGDGLSDVGSEGVIELAGREARATAPVLYRHPGGLGHGAAWILGIPASLPSGTYVVRLRLGDEVSEAGELEVVGSVGTR